MKGAFSGAIEDRIGRFQLADRGSLFLDEVGDLSPEMQPKLLRVLQDGEFQAVGDDHPRHADVRIIAASNHDLKKAVVEMLSRRPLLPAQRVSDRGSAVARTREDIPVLAHHFVEVACQRFNRSPLQLRIARFDNCKLRLAGQCPRIAKRHRARVITARLGLTSISIIGTTAVALAKKPGDAKALPRNARIVTEDEMKHRERENIAAALRQSEGRIMVPGCAPQAARNEAHHA